MGKKWAGEKSGTIHQQGLAFVAFNAASSNTTPHWKIFLQLKINTILEAAFCILLANTSSGVAEFRKKNISLQLENNQIYSSSECKAKAFADRDMARTQTQPYIPNLPILFVRLFKEINMHMLQNLIPFSIQIPGFISRDSWTGDLLLLQVEVICLGITTLVQKCCIPSAVTLHPAVKADRSVTDEDLNTSASGRTTNAPTNVPTACQLIYTCNHTYLGIPNFYSFR